MSLETGAIKGWWELCINTRHRRKVPWQPCAWEPALQVASNLHCHTEGTLVEKLTLPNIYHEPIPMRGGKGWAMNWQNRWPKQWSIKLNWASKLQIWWPKLWYIQGSDPKRSAEKTTAIIIMATRAHMQAHGKASPSYHPTDHRDCCALCVEIKLA